MKSIISNERECFICHTPINLHKHHVYEGSGRRNKSEQYGCWCYLCARHHNMSDEGVHMNREFDLKLKALCQALWMEHYQKDKEEFIKVFGKNYED